MAGILKAEQKQVFRQKRQKVNDRRNQAVEMRQQTWKAFFSVSGIYQLDYIDEEVDRETLCDPGHPLTVALVYMYSMETFLQTELNKASQNQDIMQVDSLGPFAACLNQIVIGANFDQFHSPNQYMVPSEQFVVWRAALMTEEQVESYFLAVHKRQKIQLTGFINASLNRDFALG